MLADQAAEFHSGRLLLCHLEAAQRRGSCWALESEPVNRQGGQSHGPLEWVFHASYPDPRYLIRVSKVVFDTNAFLKTALREEATLTFQSFALEGFGHDTGGFSLDLLCLPEGFAQLLNIVTIHYICVPTTEAKHVINKALFVGKKILSTKSKGLKLKLK